MVFFILGCIVLYLILAWVGIDPLDFLKFALVIFVALVIYNRIV